MGVGINGTCMCVMCLCVFRLLRRMRRNNRTNKNTHMNYSYQLFENADSLRIQYIGYTKKTVCRRMCALRFKLNLLTRLAYECVLYICIVCGVTGRWPHRAMAAIPY